MKVLVLTADRFEDSELLVPLARLREAGMAVEVASFAAGPIHGKHGAVAHADRALAAIEPGDYDALLLPGGRAPAALRPDGKALALVQHFLAAGKPVAAICHGPELLIAAGGVAGRAVTAYRSLAHELLAAGAEYRDAEVVVDGNLVTSRGPADLPAFLREFLVLLRSGAAAPRASRTT